MVQIIQATSDISINRTNTAVMGSGTRGVFSPLTWKTFSDVTDGTSNTIAASETVTSSNTGTGGSQELKGGVFAATYGTARDNCLLVASSDNISINGTPRQVWRGHWFACGRNCTTGFTAVIKPNGPNCASGNDNNNGANNYTAQSFHTGGVNVLKLDGSVAFVTDTIDNANLSTSSGAAVGKNGPNSGPSPYGIWGALGSIGGGETVSL